LLNPIVKCPKCGEGNNLGVERCIKCNTCLRPVFLGIITLLGTIFLAIGSLGFVAKIGQNPFNLVNLIISMAGIIVLISLRYGQYWAWIAIHVIWIITIAMSVLGIILGFLFTIISPHINQASTEKETTDLLGSTSKILLTSSIVETIIIGLIIVPLWIYFHTERVKAFCSVGRSKKKI
jgi:hypothetical protein